MMTEVNNQPPASRKTPRHTTRNAKRHRSSGLKLPLSFQALLYLSVILLSVTYGIIAHKYHHGIAVIIEDALETQLTLFKKPWYYIAAEGKKTIAQSEPAAMQAGLTKLVHFANNEQLAVSVIENNGTVVQQWLIDWFRIWPDAEHLSYFMQPKSAPGTMIHGAEILPDGGLVFNFEYLGMVKLNACGDVVWRLPYQTHHSIHIDEDGNIWAPDNKVRKNATATLALHTPYYVEPFILKISPDGKLLEEKSVMAILMDNHLAGALYLSSIDNQDPVVRGDTLHLNDIEVFPASLPAGVAQPGDVMISLRNINTVLLLDPVHWSVKKVISHIMLRQHDPDFIDGNTITIYDNNNRFEAGDKNAFSRIIQVNLLNDTVNVLFEGSPSLPFYTKILGKHQVLANGNRLLTESRNGRVLELDKNNIPVWEYINLIDTDTAAVIQEAQRLSPAMNAAFFKDRVAACHQGNT
jgi:hypothetical protein